MEKCLLEQDTQDPASLLMGSPPWELKINTKHRPKGQTDNRRQRLGFDWRGTIHRQRNDLPARSIQIRSVGDRL